MRRLVRVKLLVCVTPLLVLVSACVSPAWSDHDFELKAAATAEAAASAVQTVRLAVQARDRLTGPYSEVVLTGQVKALGGLLDQFAGVQPPSEASDRIRDHVIELTEDAESLVQELLIQLRRGGIEDPAIVVRRLESLGAALRSFAEAHR